MSDVMSNGKLIGGALVTLTLGAVAGYIGAYDRRLTTIENTVSASLLTEANRSLRVERHAARLDRQDEILTEIRAWMQKIDARLEVRR